MKKYIITILFTLCNFVFSQQITSNSIEHDYDNDGKIDAITTTYKRGKEFIQFKRESRSKNISSYNIIIGPNGTKYAEEDFDLDGHFEFFYITTKGGKIEEYRSFIRLKDNSLKAIDQKDSIQLHRLFLALKNVDAQLYLKNIIKSITKKISNK